MNNSNSFKRKQNLCVIPARGGSKRIPRKNIKSFLGKPIIAYSIETALKSGLFDEVMVSTDDKEIAETAKKYGATIPFYRSGKNSDDYATTAEVIHEVVNCYGEMGIEFKRICCLYPTSPLVEVEDLSAGLDLMNKKDFYTVFSIVKFSYPIWRGLEMKNGFIKMIWPDNQKKRSQDLKDSFHDAGQWYWINISHFIKNPELFTDQSGSIELSELKVQDIDNHEDWLLAELKYKALNQDESKKV